MKHIQHLTKEELTNYALSKDREKKIIASKHLHTPDAVLLRLILDKDSSVRDFARRTLERKQKLREELRELSSLKKAFKILREKEDASDEEWEFLQLRFWDLEIVNKRFVKWFDSKFGKGAHEDYDKYDHYGYYTFEFMEMVLSR